jgi:mono/diheme cytochrome c family protein
VHHTLQYTLQYILRTSAFLAAALALAGNPPDFARDIQPLLATHCAACHQGEKPAANLRLDSVASMLRGGDSGPAIIPGASPRSPLVQRLTASDKTLKMPPGKSLPEEQIRLLATWIDGMPAADATTPDFSAQVQPILAENCYQCHASARPQAQLRLDSLPGILKGGLGGPAIVPGNAAQSRLIHRVQGLHGERRMPLNGSPLTPQQIAILRAWIDRNPNLAASPQTSRSGKPIDKHWAYVPPTRPAIPDVQNPAWVRNPIDAFILARLEKEGIRPAPEASPRTLIRRLSLDLTGLPPTPKEASAFETRRDYDAQVQRLLASPHYGERWARPWLDWARYADTNGFEKDVRRTTWKYRDWVIQALNANLPFDRFTVEQIAGDMLPNATESQRIASGFHRNSMHNEEGGVDPAEAHWDVLIDRVNTTSTVWLASTVGCAQCHNHKFDPFTQKEFYQFLAFFNNAKYDVISVGDTSTRWVEKRLDLPTTEQDQKRRALQAELEDLNRQLQARTPALELEQRQWETSVRNASSVWTPLSLTKVQATGGTQLVPQPDASLLAQGPNPESEAYLLEAQISLPRISGFRLEALPDPSLPRGGPGRDVYGNATITDFTVEIAPSSGGPWQRLELTYRADDGSIGRRTKDDKALWFVDATRDEARLPRQILALPAQPILPAQPNPQPGLPAAGPGSWRLRITLGFYSELYKQGLGRFRLSATASPDPGRILEVPARTRPLLVKTERSKAEQQRLDDAFRAASKSLAPVRNRLTAVRRELGSLGMESALVMTEDLPHERPGAEMRLRGAFLSPGERVFAATLAVLHPLPQEAMPNRLGLAKWLVSRDNPLTARVLVNRIWETYFGIGLVATSEDFGSQGERPSHPELLDWLAVELMDSGWDLKHLHRLIVTSSAYRQSSAARPELVKKDPYNRLVARGARFRLEAESVRDNALAISGLLSRKVGGPSVMPYQPEGIWDVPYSNDRWMLSPGQDRYRRGLYTFLRRSSPYPQMLNFDAPSREVCTVRRPRTNTPLQALNLLNDPAFFEMAQAFARRILAEGGPTDAERATYAFLLATQRPPQPAELERILGALAREQAHFQAHPGAAQQAAGAASPAGPLAAWTLIANALLNLDEVQTRE